MNVKDIRRHNLRELATQIGGVTELGRYLKKPQSQMSHLIGINPSKNIGDRLATQIEQAFSKPPGWLDKLHTKLTQGQANPYSFKTIQSDTVQWLPILSLTDVTSFIKQAKSVIPLSYQSIPTQLKVSNKAFAIRIETNKLQDELGISLTADAIVIAEPKTEAVNGAYLIVQGDDKHSIQFHLCCDKEARLQTTMEGQGNIATLAENLVTKNTIANKVLGVVRQIILNLPN